MSFQLRKRPLLVIAALSCLIAACMSTVAESAARYGWWQGLGPVVPHETFPATCDLCHAGNGWETLRDDFEFDHEAETGVPLIGAHQQAMCLRCHNDRGPVAVFTVQGCGGCHEDVHLGQLGPNCTNCHQQDTWLPVGQIELHNRTRFPLIGTHAATACRRCHPGAPVGRFVPTDINCLSCHVNDLFRALNPNHFNLGWTFRCDRCHLPTNWNQAELD